MLNQLINNIKEKALGSDITVIKPQVGWQVIDIRELLQYRDLLYFLVWRDIKILYAQTVLGFSWAILQPLTQIILFTIIFGNVAKLATDGVPYFLFSTVAIIPWNYMSQAMTQASQSLVTGQNMLGKIYFPRLFFPMAPILARLVDFTISMVIILFVAVYYRVYPTWNLVLLPFFIILMACVSISAGFWMSALAIRFRDVRHAMPFALRMLMYTAPVVYSASSIPDTYRFIYSLNPLVAVIEGFRACLLGTTFPWPFIWPGIITTIMIFISGIYYFKRNEKVFADVI